MGAIQSLVMPSPVADKPAQHLEAGRGCLQPLVEMRNDSLPDAVVEPAGLPLSDRKVYAATPPSAKPTEQSPCRRHFATKGL
jgi:hypothetical protein